MTRQLAGIGTAVMTTILALVLLWQFRIVVVYVLFSLALAAAMRPLLRRQTGRSLAARLAPVLLYLVLFGSFGFLLVVSGGAALRDIQQVAQQVSVADEWRQPGWLQDTSIQQLLDARVPPPSELLAAIIGVRGELVLPALLGITQGVITLVSGGLVVLFLSLYWTMDQNHFERLWLSLLPPRQRNQARHIWQTVEYDLGAYIRSEAAQSLLAGFLLALGYWLLGSPYPALLAVTGALALLVPLVGVALAVIPPLLLGLLTSVQLGLVTAFYAIVVMVALKFWVEPRLSSHRQVNPMLTIVILIALADAYGLLGIIVAPPLSAACQILWSSLVTRRAVSGPAAPIADVKERHARVEAAIRAMEEPPPMLSSTLERLTHLLEQTEQTLQVAVDGPTSEPTRTIY
jgi:putative permease